MVNLLSIIQKVEKFTRDNSPAILTAIGVTGTVTTAYLAAEAAYESHDVIERTQKHNALPLTKREKFEAVWDLYIPAAISGATTIGCIIFAAKAGAKKTAAVTAMYSLSEKAFSEYQAKVVETLGENKEKKLRDELVQERVAAGPPGSIIISGGGDVLCYENFTGRYFTSNMESLRKAQNDVNFKLMQNLYVPLDEFYYMLGLPSTKVSGEFGWESGRQLDLEFTTILSEDSRPCLAFDYNYTKKI